MPVSPLMSALTLTFTTLPDQESAEHIARRLVEAGVAACVNVMAPCRSVYRWEGEVRADGEVPLVIKSTSARRTELFALLKQMHPYELPEIVSVEIADGLPAYLEWVAQECTMSPPPAVKHSTTNHP